MTKPQGTVRKDIGRGGGGGSSRVNQNDPGGRPRRFCPLYSSSHAFLFLILTTDLFRLNCNINIVIRNWSVITRFFKFHRPSLSKCYMIILYYCRVYGSYSFETTIHYNFCKILQEKAELLHNCIDK